MARWLGSYCGWWRCLAGEVREQRGTAMAEEVILSISAGEVKKRVRLFLLFTNRVYVIME